MRPHRRPVQQGANETLTASDLASYTGTEHWHRHPLARRFTYTDGVRHVAEAGGAYWLLDKILLSQGLPALAAEDRLQVWTLVVPETGDATLTATGGDGRVLHAGEIGFTDFPLPAVTLWLSDRVLLLPSDY